MSPGSHVTVNPTQILFGSIAVFMKVQGFLAGYCTGTIWSKRISGFNTVADQHSIYLSYKAHHAGPKVWMREMMEKVYGLLTKTWQIH